MAEQKSVKSSSKRAAKPHILSSFGGYFTGAWYELRQVRWPDRRATWGLTLAVMAFSLFFAAVILGLDFVFQYIFKELILK